jgi:Putative zinc-finger
MIFESCSEIRESFSDLLDGMLEPELARAMRFHLDSCLACRQELDEWESIQDCLRRVRRRQVPSEVSLRLRVKMSQELHRNVIGCWLVRFENFFRPVLLPSLGGVLTAIICVGLMMGEGVPPVSNTPDVPTDLATPPQVQQLAPVTLNTDDRPLVLVTYVNADGRVTSYRVLSGQSSPKLMQQLDLMLYFSIFRPATTFGQPTNGRVVLSFRRITVRG